MTDELKPLRECPFCKSNKVEIYSNEDYVFGRCRECGANGTLIELDSESESYQDGDIEREEIEAMDAWNNRPADLRLEKALAFIRKVDEMMPDGYEEPIVWLCDLEDEARELLGKLENV